MFILKDDFDHWWRIVLRQIGGAQIDYYKSSYLTEEFKRRIMN